MTAKKKLSILVLFVMLSSVAGLMVYHHILVPSAIEEISKSLQYSGPIKDAQVLGTLHFKDFINHHKSGIHDIEFWIVVDKINKNPIEDSEYPHIDWAIINKGYLDDDGSFKLSPQLKSLQGKKLSLVGQIYQPCNVNIVIKDPQDEPSRCFGFHPATHIPLFRNTQDDELELIAWPE